MGDVTAVKRKGHFWSTDSKYAYLFLLPATVFLLVFMIYPILNVVIMSLYHTDKLGRFVHFNGFRNFADLFQKEDFQLFQSVALWRLFLVGQKIHLSPHQSPRPKSSAILLVF